MAERREYETSHPWITFTFDPSKITPPVWILLGEARSKCEHLAGSPLQPKTAQKLNQVFLAKGVRATTAIEGNTLSQEQVLQQIEGTLDLPISKQYLAQEVQNVIDAYNGLWNDIRTDKPIALTIQRICEWNALMLRKLETAPEVRPGELRTHSVGVLSYRGAPAVDCPYLMNRLVDWLNEPSFKPDREHAVIKPILAAILAHLYLAWIHPFGDGNGRTARLIEFAILVRGGVPMPAAHLLSNHYNETRTEYYRQLDMASRSGGDIVPFIRYAMQGFVDGLRDQISRVREQQMDVAWVNFIHEQLRTIKSGDGVVKRRRELMLEMSPPQNKAEFRTVDQIAQLSPAMIKLYAGRTQKTLRRDLTALVFLGLVVVNVAGAYKPNVEIIAAFLPARKSPDMPTPTVRQG